MNNNAKITKRAVKKTTIAIMGATSHIAKGLIYHFLQDDRLCLFLFARKTEQVYGFLKKIGGKEGKNLTICAGYQTFPDRCYDVVINCIGLGTVSEEPHIYTSFFMVTEEFDNRVLSYLHKFPRTLYINFSSGAVYGKGFSEPAEKDTVNALRINGVTRDDYFTIAKLNSEAKHRAFAKLNIIDIRIFSYFSRFVDITGKYFITEMLSSIIHNKVFHTSENNIVRDYIHPDDLFALIMKCLKIKRINTAIDAYSLRPVGKREILKFFSSRYNLTYKTVKTKKYRNVTGQKIVYYSTYKKAGNLGYKPRYSSMDTLKQEVQHLIQGLAAPKATRGVTGDKKRVF
jgi:nucleoside-diphosphate-sugar epimerase